MTTRLLAFLSLSVQAQISDLIPDSFKDLDVVDERLQDIWPRYFSKTVEVIPKGSTENNSPGFWLTATYSTVQQLTGDVHFEVELKLHSPKQENNYIYVTWFQMVDPYLTNPSRDFYESFSCGTRYDPLYAETVEAKTEKEAVVNSNYLYPIAYRGVKRLNEAQGYHDQLLIDKKQLVSEQTKNYAWTVMDKDTKVKRDPQNGIYEEICRIERQYTHEHSNVPLEPFEKLELNIGYKVYKSPKYVFPEYSGYREKIFWSVANPPETHGMQVAVMASLLLSSFALLV